VATRWRCYFVAAKIEQLLDLTVMIKAQEDRGTLTEPLHFILYLILKTNGKGETRDKVLEELTQTNSLGEI
jgi:hypothetical protein